MVVDFHAHIGQSKVFGNRFVNAKGVVEVMDRHGIDKAVLLPTASSINTRYYLNIAPKQTEASVSTVPRGVLIHPLGGAKKFLHGGPDQWHQGK